MIDISTCHFCTILKIIINNHKERWKQSHKSVKVDLREDDSMQKAVVLEAGRVTRVYKCQSIVMGCCHLRQHMCLSGVKYISEPCCS